MKRVQFFIQSVMVCGAVLAAQPAFPWGDVGHQIVGDIAEQTADERTKQFVRGILGVESLAVASIWPDHVRDDSRFGDKKHVSKEHYVEHHDYSQFHQSEIPTGSTFDSREKKPSKDAHGAITNAMTVLIEKSYGRNEKIIALRYLVHVVGDIHQPLHVGNGYDRGANGCKIKWEDSIDGKLMMRNMNLHSFWDSEIVEYMGAKLRKSDNPRGNDPKYFAEYIKLLKKFNATRFTKEAKQAHIDDLSPAERSAVITRWLEESKTIRENGLYPDKPGSMKDVPFGEEYKNRSYCHWFRDQENDNEPANGWEIDPAAIPLLDSAYGDKFALVVEKQLITAGLRLAVILDYIARNAQTPAPMNDAEQESIIKRVHDSLKNM